MTKSVVNTLKNIVSIVILSMFFSCSNNVQEVRDFLADKNLPIGEAYNIDLKYTDSGVVRFRLKAPLMLDFSNRTFQPYSEFPKGVKITSIDKNNDSTIVTGDYAISYKKTEVSEIKNNVVIYNVLQKHKLETNQIYWDQKTHYFFTDDKFTFFTQTDTIRGVGFEASEDLKNWWVKNQTGVLQIKE